MMRILRNRALVARAAGITITACGTVAGYFLGCALAVQLAENWLDQYSRVTVEQGDASFTEARSLLTVLKDSPYFFCSEAEIAYFRELVFRSEYLKDAGRIRGGKIECSATADHPMRSNVQLNSESTQKDGLIAYSNLLPIRDAHLQRAGLQLGSAYVVLGSHMPTGPGPLAMQLAVSGKDAGGQQTGFGTKGASDGEEAIGISDGIGRQGDMLYATRCSTLRLSCATASASVSEALRGESSTISGSAVVGGLSGVLLGMAFSFFYNRNRDLCQQLRRAISCDKLQVVYQPIVNLVGGRIVGAEALARWTDEDGNTVGPDVFVKIAEEHGFVGAITKVVVRRALHEFAERLRTHPDFRLSVNVAAADLSDPSFLPMLDDSLNQARVKSRSLVIEITERSTASSEAAMETIRNLRRQGHSIHIDDFGTGYSNLDKLLYLFADTIKIDKAFTRVIGTEAVTVAILPQILAMAKSLNLDVVVEGVETDHQADYFSPAKQQIYGQGWLYGHPVTADEFHGLLADDCSKALPTPDPAALWPAKANGLRVMGTRTA
jgi:sensor c-di-GMP phosphodiesterase-like protein